MDELTAGLVQEMRRGTIVLCVLARLRKPMYGYSLVGELAQGGIAVEANTLYPLLRRLEGQGLLQSQWDTGENKPRKYYLITALGLEVLAKLKQNWDETSLGVNKLWEEA